MKREIRKKIIITEWNYRRFLAKLIGYVILIGGTLVSLYIYFIGEFALIEMIGGIFLSIILGGLGLLISKLYI